MTGVEQGHPEAFGGSGFMVFHVARHQHVGALACRLMEQVGAAAATDRDLGHFGGGIADQPQGWTSERVLDLGGEDGEVDRRRQPADAAQPNIGPAIGQRNQVVGHFFIGMGLEHPRENFAHHRPWHDGFQADFPNGLGHALAADKRVGTRARTKRSRAQGAERALIVAAEMTGARAVEGLGDPLFVPGGHEDHQFE